MENEGLARCTLCKGCERRAQIPHFLVLGWVAVGGSVFHGPAAREARGAGESQLPDASMARAVQVSDARRSPASVSQEPMMSILRKPGVLIMRNPGRSKSHTIVRGRVRWVKIKWLRVAFE